MTRRYLSRVNLILLFTALVIFTGCGLWVNFTTYFNLYYNTVTLFEEAEDEILTQKRDLFSTEPLIVPGGANTKLVKVIEKSSKILQFHSTSSYVEDALLMLGKSFYYQKNFQKSKRKFEELLITEPDEDTRLEADFWIARCNMSLRDFIGGLAQLEDVRLRAIEDDNTKIIRDSYIEEIVHRISGSNYNQAIQLSQELILHSNSQMKSSIYYELGKLYTELGDIENAISSYQSVFDFSPDFDLDIVASISLAKTLREADRNEESLEVFRDMRRKDKFQEKFSEIDLETAVTLKKLNRFEEALELFSVIDTTYRGTASAAAASYYKGRIYEYDQMNYDSASVYYQKAFTSNPPQEYAQPIREKNQLFNRYFSLRKQIDNYNQQLFYAENPDIFVQDSINYVQDSLKILSEYLEQQELHDIWSNVFMPDPVALQDSLSAMDSLRIADSIHVRDSLITLMNIGEFADTNEVNILLKDYFRGKDSLYIRDSLMALIDIGELSDTNQVNSILADHFRALDESGDKQKSDQTSQPLTQTIAGVNLDTVQFKRNPPKQPVIALDSVKYIISKAQLELGNLFLAELDVSDSAYILYTKNIEHFPESDFYTNTLFALGSYYQTIDNKQKADSLFQYIYDNHKEESIVNAAADKLNLPLIDLEYDPAKTLYSSAESKMLAGDYDLALKEFLSIHRLYPESKVSPQALFAGGWILEKDLRLLDSAAVVYDTLVANYASSVYSREVAKKLGGYKQELARIKKEEEEAKLLESKGIDKTDIQLADKEAGQDSVDQISQIYSPDLTELVKKEQERKQDEQITPDVLMPDTEVQRPKLEALWNPRKPR